MKNTEILDMIAYYTLELESLRKIFATCQALDKARVLDDIERVEALVKQLDLSRVRDTATEPPVENETGGSGSVDVQCLGWVLVY